MTDADMIRKKIQSRLLNMQFSLKDNLTPLFLAQTNDTIALYEKALKGPTNSLISLDLDIENSYTNLLERWSMIHGPWLTRAVLIKDMFMCKDFLIRKLLEDYANEPYIADVWAPSVAKVIAKHNDPAGMEDEKNLELYQLHITLPLEEMMINREWVEKRFCAVFNRPEHQCSDIQPLIDRCDWPNLAAALVEDHRLALQIFQGTEIDRDIVLSSNCQKIHDGLDKTKKKYFSLIADPFTFVPNAYAKKLSAKQISNHTKHESHLNQGVSTNSAGLNTIASSSKSEAYSTSIANFEEEKTSHLRNKKTVSGQASNAIALSSEPKTYPTSDANSLKKKTSFLGNKKTR